MDNSVTFWSRQKYTLKDSIPTIYIFDTGEATDYTTDVNNGYL